MKGWVGYIGKKTSEAVGLSEAPERGDGLDWTALELNGLAGDAFDTDSLKGQVVLVVNVASKCGLTPQYKGLQALYDTYKDRGLQIVGVPCNQFLGQEPGTAEEIAGFCSLNYGVTFPLLEKQQVNGSDRGPLYDTLVESEAGAGMPIKWNFEKFLVGRDGKILHRFAPKTTPNAPEIIAAIDAALEG